MPTPSKKRFILLETGLACLGVAALLLSYPLPVDAITLVPACARGTDLPSLQCAMQTFRNIAALILGLTGSFALLMFVYGGFTMLTSAGNPDKIKEGKTIVKNAVIGIFLILLAGYIIDYVVGYLRGTRTVSEGSACADGNGILRTPPGGSYAICIYRDCKAAGKHLGSEDYGCYTVGSEPGQGSNCVSTLSPCAGEGAGCCVPNPPAEPATAPEPMPMPMPMP